MASHPCPAIRHAVKIQSVRILFQVFSVSRTKGPRKTRINFEVHALARPKRNISPNHRPPFPISRFPYLYLICQLKMKR